MEILYLAGINDSGPGHWQNHWLKRLGGTWVEHLVWSRPKASDWVADLQLTLQSLHGPKVVMAHSLGCLTLSRWVEKHQDPNIRGAFLVAPPDPTSPSYPKEALGFGDPFDIAFPFPSVLVASQDDPYASLDYSERLAEKWGSEFLDVGKKGHINLGSRLGSWDEGLKAFQSFRQRLGETP
jgi:predicted alpha/beta hydrolase family esterase